MISDFTEITKNRWDFLLVRDDSHSFFQTWEWNSLWAKHFAKGKECFLLDDRENEEEDRSMFLPLYGDMCKGKKLLRAIGHDLSDYVDVVASGHARPSFFIENLQSCFNGVARCVELKHVQRSAALFDMVLNSPRIHSVVSEKTLAYSLDLKDDAAVKKTIEKRRLRDYKRQLSKRASLQVLHLTEQKDIEKYLDDFFALHIKRWQRSGTLSYFHDSCYKLFYADLAKMRVACPVLSVMLSGTDGVAMHFGFMYRDVFYYYTPAFNKAYSKYMPGQLMVVELIRFAINKNCTVFDMTVGAESYKKRFTNRVVDVYTILLYGSKARADLARLYYSVKNFLKRFVWVRFLVGVKRKWGLGNRKLETRN